MCLRASKKLGQNFLENRLDLEAIAAALCIQKDDTVLEIGPGLGALTEELLRSGAQVVGVEKDRHMVAHLAQRWPSSQFRVVESDILELNIRELIASSRRIKVAGNIPYNITSPILFWVIDQAEFISEAVFTVQKELADRLCATPGGRIWGALSVMVQSQADVRIMRHIPRSHFFPVPNVDSAVVHLMLLEKPAFEAKYRETFSFCVAKAFQKRRKMLLNALENEEMGWDKAKLQAEFAFLKIDPKRRPETLAISEWSAIASRLGKTRPT